MIGFIGAGLFSGWLFFSINIKKINIVEYLDNEREKLMHPNNWRRITLSRAWTAEVPNEAGVYPIKEGDKLVYVGETGNLRGRMNDLLDSRHHTLRRTIGHKLFADLEGYLPATTKKKFPSHIEVKVNEHIHNNLSSAFLKVALGRKELEELIETQIELEVRLNKRGKRKTI